MGSLKKILEILESEIIVGKINLGRVGEVLLLVLVLFFVLCSQKMIACFFVALLVLFEAMIILKKIKKSKLYILLTLFLFVGSDGYIQRRDFKRSYFFYVCSAITR
jgi:hypothetical protein